MNGYAVQSLAHSLPFDTRGAADVINVPVLIVPTRLAGAKWIASQAIVTVLIPSPSEETPSPVSLVRRSASRCPQNRTEVS